MQTKVEVEDRSVGSAVGTVQVWMGHKRLKKGRFPPRRQRAADPLLQLQADEKVEERGGGRAGGTVQRCVGESGGGTYLSSVCSVKPAAHSAARYCTSTLRTLFMNPLDRGKSGKPMSG